MKTGAAVCAIGTLLFISVLSPETFWGASAQSGRVVPKPTPPPPAESPKQPEPRPKFVADPDADKYKLVFPISLSKKIYKDPPKNRTEKKRRETENFADQRADIELAPSSKETIKTLNSLVKEGFAVRDLFNFDPGWTKKASILLERTQ